MSGVGVSLQLNWLYAEHKDGTLALADLKAGAGQCQAIFVLIGELRQGRRRDVNIYSYWSDMALNCYKNCIMLV